MGAYLRSSSPFWCCLNCCCCWCWLISCCKEAKSSSAAILVSEIETNSNHNITPNMEESLVSVSKVLRCNFVIKPPEFSRDLSSSTLPPAAASVSPGPRCASFPPPCNASMQWRSFGCSGNIDYMLFTFFASSWDVLAHPPPALCAVNRKYPMLVYMDIRGEWYFMTIRLGPNIKIMLL